MHLNLLRDIPELLTGYSDPEGYAPESGPRLDDLDPFRQFDRYRLALESMARMLDPNLQDPVIGDSHHGQGIDPIHAEVLAAHYGGGYAGLLEKAQGAPLSEKGTEYALWHRDPGLKAAGETGLPRRTEWFPGWHVAVLRGGDPEGHTALYLNGYACGGHRHYDSLGLIYIAHGREMAADRGYIWDDPRNAWTRSTLSHNIVTVDGRSQEGRPEPAALELFGAGAGVEVVQASARQYEQCGRYQRTCALVQLPGGGTYAVDFFRVDGGRLHQYGFHCNGGLAGLRGVDLEPVDEEIEWLGNLRAGRPRQPFTATWQEQEVRMDLTLLNPVDRLLLADAPGWRSDTGDQLHAPPVQQILAERRGAADLSSRYAAVITPYVEESPVRGARLLLDDPATGALGIAVERQGCTDYNPLGAGGRRPRPRSGLHRGPLRLRFRRRRGESAAGLPAVRDHPALRRPRPSARPGAGPAGGRLGAGPHLPPRRSRARAGSPPRDLAAGGGYWLRVRERHREVDHRARLPRRGVRGDPAPRVGRLRGGVTPRPRGAERPGPPLRRRMTRRQGWAVRSPPHGDPVARADRESEAGGEGGADAPRGARVALLQVHVLSLQEVVDPGLQVQAHDLEIQPQVDHGEGAAFIEGVDEDRLGPGAVAHVEGDHLFQPERVVVTTWARPVGELAARCPDPWSRGRGSSSGD